MFRRMQVEVANVSGEKFRLDYQIRATESAQLWAQCIHEASPHGLSETERFHNFPGHRRSDIDKLVFELEHIILRLKSQHPELDFPKINPNDLQKSVNQLHFHFAHSHHVTQVIHAGNAEDWRQFNLLLHDLEWSFSELETRKNSGGLFGALIHFSWNSTPLVPIPDVCYQDFTLARDFGTAYINYAQVGRHFLEITFASDEDLADEHIQPARVLSGNTRLWFGPTCGHQKAHYRRGQIENWFVKNQARLARLGFHWGDPRLALGFIPVARLEQQIYTPAELRDFVSTMAKYNRVAHVCVD